MNRELLKTPIEYLKGVGPELGDLLRGELDIRNYEELLYFMPNRYLDKSKYYKIDELGGTPTEVQIIGKIIQVRQVKLSKKASRLTAAFEDETGRIELVWFKKTKWIKQTLKVDQTIVVSGKTSVFNNKITLVHPDLETIENHRQNRKSSLHAVYPLTDKLTRRRINQKYYRRLFINLFDKIGDESIEESLSQVIREEYQLLNRKQALFNIHFPQKIKTLNRAQYTLKFEELFYMQLTLFVRQSFRKSRYKSYPFKKIGRYFNNFYQEQLPFELTSAQKRVIKEIRNDLGRPVQMNRLLQGDVGSGKTIVALMTMLIAIDNSFQAALMAPTEILAIQHYQVIFHWAQSLGIKVKLLTGSTSQKNRKKLHRELIEGSLNILIGTHAIIEDKVRFSNLGLMVIDEQHRFGVAQRAAAYKKNDYPPHILVMTATPIPRTLAMSIYGDLDISIIDELPSGRKPIKTIHRRDNNRLAVFSFVKNQVKKGRQVYIVYPLIEESEKLDFKDLMDGYESISRAFPLPDYKISIVHGKMKPSDKDFEMNRFIKGETQIMVATTVIEVGVNVPNATVMIIESAQRFGLSQLHQLRGRVGRGGQQSYCILMTDHKLSNEAKTRIKTICATTDGFKIAEADLKLRGPGNILGTRQSGIPELKIADLVKDSAIIEKARNAARHLLEGDPHLSKKENQTIRKRFDLFKKNALLWGRVS